MLLQLTMSNQSFRITENNLYTVFHSKAITSRAVQ